MTTGRDVSPLLYELNPEECVRLLASGGVGRLAFWGPAGQEIIPVNFTLVDDAIVCRTAPCSELGWDGPGTEAAFEADGLDPGHKTGWSVVARGRLQVVDSQAEVAAIKLGGDPQPWAGGVRHLYLKLVWRELTGRRIETISPTWPAAPVVGGRQLPLGPTQNTARRARRTGQPPRW
jgi:hypothetical protein